MFILGMPNQSNMNMQGPPRGPPPAPQMGHGAPNNMGQQQMPAPHVNPAFFNQNSGKRATTNQAFNISFYNRLFMLIEYKFLHIQDRHKGIHTVIQIQVA